MVDERVLARRPDAWSEQARARARRVQHASLKAMLGVVFIYLVAGNVPRILQLGAFRDNVNTGEAVLFATALCVGALNPAAVRYFVIKWFPVWPVILASAAWGILLNGFSLGPVLYAPRLVLLLFAGVVTGFALYRLHGTDIRAVLRYFVASFLLVAVSGVIIYFAFPNLTLMWVWLAQYGIVFHGDPHIHRLVATYFDPNFYSICASMYLIFCFVLFRLENRTKWALAFAFVLITIFLSGSRTGLVTAVLTLMGIGWQTRSGFVTVARAHVVSKHSARTVLAGLALLALTAPVWVVRVLIALNRISNADTELSALSRVQSFQVGMALFEEHPWLGLGYNYLAPRAAEMWGATGINSAIQTTLASFGIPVALLFAFAFLTWARSTWLRLSWRTGDRAEPFAAYGLFLYYLIVVILLSSQLNNAVYYPLWQVPVVAFATYLSLIARERRDPGSGSIGA